MKTLLRVSLFLLAAVFARADLVIEQKLESQFMNGNSVMKIKGDQARMDMPSPVGGGMTMLFDLKAGQISTLVHQNKMVMKMSLADAKKAAEASQKLTGIDLTKVEPPKPTGQKEKVGEWDCEIYEGNFGGNKTRMWVAKDYPNFKSIMDQMNKISSATSAGMGLDPSKYNLNGMTVKTEVSTAAGKVTTTLVKVSDEAVPDSEFKVPEGYTEMKMPLPGGR